MKLMNTHAKKIFFELGYLTFLLLRMHAYKGFCIGLSQICRHINKKHNWPEYYAGIMLA